MFVEVKKEGRRKVRKEEKEGKRKGKIRKEEGKERVKDEEKVGEREGMREGGKYEYDLDLRLQSTKENTIGSIK